jgi:hypothetical protein
LRSCFLNSVVTPTRTLLLSKPRVNNFLMGNKQFPNERDEARAPSGDLASRRFSQTLGRLNI